MASKEVLSDPDLRQRVEDRMESYQIQLVERLNQDRDAGLLSTDPEPPTIASGFVTYQQGIWRMAYGVWSMVLLEYDSVRFRQQIDVFLTALGL